MQKVTITQQLSDLLPYQIEIGDNPDHIGGEGKIFFSLDNRYVVKIYNQPGPDKKNLLENVIKLGKNLGEDAHLLAWPLGIVDKLDAEDCLGCVGLKVPSSHVNLTKLIYTRNEAIKQIQQGRNWLDYLKIARSIAAAVRTIHGKGMAHADLHWKNFLVDISTGEAILIDLDGLVVKGFLPPQVKGVRGFIAPEVEMGLAKPSEATDRHSAAVLILWTLLFRNVMEPQICYDAEDDNNDGILGYGEKACFSEHPSDRRNWPPSIGLPLIRQGFPSFKMLTPKLQELTEKTLIDGLHDAKKRPQVWQWEKALAEAQDVTICCSHCEQSFIYPYWIHPAPRRHCPFCGTSVRSPRPVVLELLEEKTKGIYLPTRSIVLDRDRPLFVDTIERSQIPPFNRDGLPILGRTIWDANKSIHCLISENGTAWQLLTAGSGIIKCGKSVELRRGLVLYFSDAKRLLRVVE
ncbi:hypothetical protein IQ270_00735 [Microcoleus sp. LEGE 07076]|uniref:lipopolysaccharide kinase InaA family protein n=1 Tax=Microcoleus sp. LEGE 07076 TaxID=915322 RepID=UPI00188214EF|nr:lipopolysaccharide kinase InaA family protein [Microcoleus sp. LEGE 07076]MBE9183286.1 hypothetical protein [Microcoleus sp. LEGE 07076]